MNTDNDIKTPVTYRIAFQNITGYWPQGTVYYSLCRAVRSYLYYEEKYKARRVIWLYAYKGDMKIQTINVNDLLK